MPKGYMLSAHRSTANPKKREAYIKLAVPALQKSGGKIIVSTDDVVIKENGIKERTVLIEFDSFDQAIKAYESQDYQEALKAMDGGADRDFRIFEGL
jgi:uncharacterized protein (DUF1330 family)